MNKYEIIKYKKILIKNKEKKKNKKNKKIRKIRKKNKIN